MSGIISAMEFGIATHQARAYTVATPVYQGPLDLLLQLIERAELDITRLALAQVTDQYLEHLHNLSEGSAEEVSAFLIIAARLLQIKSEVLLPQPPVREQDEEDPGEALARQLLAYKRFKEIANFLAEREASGLHTYLRLAPPPKIDGSFDIGSLTLSDLAAAAQALFIQKDPRQPLATVVSAPRVTIREKIHLITDRLRWFRRVSFHSLFDPNPAHLDVVVTFLAMLELIKQHLIQVRQEGLFGKIELEPSANWNEDESFDLEFGE